jgi:hypothetical protein
MMLRSPWFFLIICRGWYNFYSQDVIRLKIEIMAESVAQIYALKSIHTMSYCCPVCLSLENYVLCLMFYRWVLSQTDLQIGLPMLYRCPNSRAVEIILFTEMIESYIVLHVLVFFSIFRSLLWFF